jgi:hypothetical protein
MSESRYKSLQEILKEQGYKRAVSKKIDEVGGFSGSLLPDPNTLISLLFEEGFHQHTVVVLESVDNQYKLEIYTGDDFANPDDENFRDIHEH